MPGAIGGAALAVAPVIVGGDAGGGRARNDQRLAAKAFKVAGSALPGGPPVPGGEVEGPPVPGGEGPPVPGGAEGAVPGGAEGPPSGGIAATKTIAIKTTAKQRMAGLESERFGRVSALTAAVNMTQISTHDMKTKMSLTCG